jgi:HD-like signal output (HDOD) protein
MLGWLKRSASKEAQHKTERLSGAILEAISAVAGSRGIPIMPQAAQKAFQLATDPSAEARDFIEIIEADEALAARVLKIANSVFFDRGKASTTIEEAVLVIGINELRCLLNATALSEIFSSRLSERTQLWANDIATALIAKRLAQRFFPAKTELAFLGGLMHDVGKLFMLQRAGEEYRRVLGLVSTKAMPFCQAEEEVFVFNHCEAGQLIGERWNFSPELTHIVRYHHQPFTAEDLGGKIATLTALIKCADTLAHALGLGQPASFSRMRMRAEEELGDVWQVLGIADKERKDLLAGFKRTFDLEYELYAGTSPG